MGFAQPEGRVERKPLPIRFVVEASQEEVLLAEHDLPPEVPQGIKRLRTVTRYSDEHVSVQVHGLELKPIELTGTIDDTWWGAEGHAASMAENLRTLASDGDLVRFEYDDLQLWGLFDVELTRKTVGWYEYKISFEPYWQRNPSFAFVPLATPEAGSATDWGERAAARAEELRAQVAALPAGLDSEWLTALTQGISQASVYVSDAMAPLRNAARWSELTRDQVERARAILPRAITTYQSSVKRIQSSAIDVIAQSAVAKLAGFDSTWQIERSVRSLQVELLGILRRLIEIHTPLRQLVHIVGERDTLPRLAQRYLGDYERWPEIADANNLETPLLVPGQALDIPVR